MAEIIKTDWHTLETWGVSEGEQQNLFHDDSQERSTLLLNETYYFFIPDDRVDLAKRVVALAYEDDLLPDALDKMFPLDAPFSDPENLIEVLKRIGAEQLPLDE